MDKKLELGSRKLKQKTLSGNSRDLTLQEVADCFDITSKRVRQIEAIALRKMHITLINKGISGSFY